MPQSTNLNSSPYFDDFNPLKDFHRVLFRPGYSIQARELTTLQSILQNQIENLSKSKFKQGSVVVPGQLIFDDKYNFVKVSSFTNNLLITDFIGKFVTGSTSGVSAKIVNATPATDTDSATIFVKYENSGTNNKTTTFVEGETLIATSQGNPSLVVGVTGSSLPLTSGALGYGSSVTVQEGIYFINGFLVSNSTETVILEKYSNKPNAKVGFNITESLITPEEDLSLLDNAQGYSNFSSPGAHRLKVSVSLTSKAVDSPDTKDFAELILIEGGAIKRTVEVNSTTLFEDVLARRTYDESGDYVVRDFGYSLKENLNTGFNNGLYTVDQGGDDAKFTIALNPGKAYVKGYEIETKSTTYIDADKAREVFTDNGVSLSATEGSNFTINNQYNFPDVEKLTVTLGGSSITATNAYQEILLYDVHHDLTGGDTAVNVDSNSPEAIEYYHLSLRGLNNTSSVPVGTTYTITSGGYTQTGTIVGYFLSESKTYVSAIVTRNNSSTLTVIGGETITITGGITATIFSSEYIQRNLSGLAKTKYLKFLSGSSNSNKQYDTATSQFKLGLFANEYFTRIKFKNNIAFTVGKYVTGQVSGAVGIVEKIYTSTNSVILSKVTGTFIPGETVNEELIGTSSQFNVIEQEGTVSYLKANSTGSGYPATGSGITVYFNGVLQSTITVNDLKINSNKLTAINISQNTTNTAGVFTSSPTVTISGTSGAGADFVAILHNKTVRNYDASLVKCYFNSASNGNAFGGDIASVDSTYEITNSSTYSAAEGSYYIVSDNLNSQPSSELIPGDLIQIVDDANVLRKYVVRAVSNTGSTQSARIFVRGVVLSSFKSKIINRVRSKLNGVAQDSLLVSLPNTNVKTAVLNTVNTNINYTTQYQFINKLGSSGTISISLGTNEAFLPFSTDNYIFTDVTDLSTSNGGKLIDLTGAVTYTNNNATININLGASFANVVFKLIAPVVKTNTTPKTKSLVQNQSITISTNITDPVIPLNYADGVQLRGIYQSLTGNLPTTSDLNITDRFIFDGGQRDTHYDLARIIRKPGTQAPTSSFLVVFDYYKHSGTGDYFTVDSYTNTNYKDIPRFDSKVYGNISLADYVDFRPRVSDFSINDATTTQLPGYTDKIVEEALKFSGAGSSFSRIPIYGTTIQTGYSYYLSRIDALYLTKDGKFVISKGTPSANPQNPPEIADGMQLLYLNIPAYTYNVADIKVKTIDNTRYTMKDIGSLKKRIEKLEYYTVLSLAEQDTFNTQIRDNLNTERFKNGVLVDNFEGHSVGNTSSTDYRCSIDTQSGLLRPSYVASQTSLEESVSTDLERTANGYVRKGDLVTLSYTEQSTVSVPSATRNITVNPGESAKYAGVMKLNPDIDEWKDTTTAPELIVNENSVFDTIKNQPDSCWGSFWNEWQISWTGVSTYALANSTDFKTSNQSSSTSQFDSSTSNIVKALTRTRTRNGTQNRTTAYGSSSSSVGQKELSNSYNPYIRTNIVKFTATGLKPNTQLYAFFEGVDVNAWVNPDNVTVTPYTGTGGYAQKGFGTNIITDSNGNVSGIFLIPNGYPPVANSTIVSLDSIDYGSFFNTSGTFRQFTTGTKTFRLTSSQSNSNDSNEVSTFVESEYTVSGLVSSTTGSIQSTRLSPYARRTLTSSTTVQTIDTVKYNVNSGTNFIDPLAQTFSVEGYPDGIFATSLDLYFNSKSDTRPISVYLVSTDGTVPTSKVLPFSQVSLNPDTVLRIRCSTNITTTFNVNETITGVKSGATATIKTAQVVSNSSTRYNLILSNHNGISFIPGEEITLNKSPAITAVKFYIDQDSGYIEKIKVNNFGNSYTASGTTVQLVGDNAGGTVPTLTPKIYDGNIYDIKVGQSSGYYSAPTVTIVGGDGSAKATAYVKINNPAVKMGVATSTDASIKTTFTFDSPVYLQNNTIYGIVIATDSSDYSIYTARVGDTVLNSTNLATAKPYVGSIFKSQNSSAYVEDTVEDVKFNLNRAVFNTSSFGSIQLLNSDVGAVLLEENPLEISNTTGTSNLFGANSRVVRVRHKNHGMKAGDTVILSGVQGSGSNNSVLGIPANNFNGVFYIANVGLDDYTIYLPDSVWNNPTISSSGRAGGKTVTATTNKVFQIIYPQISTLEFASSTLQHSVRTAYGYEVDGTSSKLPYSLSTLENVSPNDNYYFDSTRVIASVNNELLRSTITELNKNKSLLYQVNMSTTSDNVSPVIDLRRCNVVTIANRVDNPSGNESRFGTKTQTLYVTNGIGYDASASPSQQLDSTIITYNNITGGIFGLTTDTSSTRLTQTGNSGQIVSVDSTNRILQLIDLTGTFTVGQTIAQASSGTSAIITSVTTKKGVVIGWDGTSALKVRVTTPYVFAANDLIRNFSGSTPLGVATVSGVTNATGFLYVDEVEAENGSASSKYVTKEVTLDTPATALDVRISANLFNNSDIKVLYKIKPDGNAAEFNSLKWQYFNSTGYSDNYSTVSPVSTKTLSPSVEDLSSYLEYKYTASNLPSFKSFAVKIVFLTSNPTLSPRLEDLRVIAHS